MDEDDEHVKSIQFPMELLIVDLLFSFDLVSFFDNNLE
jgi:hypothetical protein